MTAIRVDDDGAVRHLVLCRPDEYNTITPELREALVETLDAADSDPTVRVVLLRAEGRAFCSGYGLDWSTAAQATEEGRARVWDSMADLRMIGRFAEAFARLHTISKPTVAAVHGWCIAGGTDLVLNADLIVAGESARFGYPPARVWGIPEAPWLWVARLGLEQAKRYLLTGDEIDAKEAERLGLVLECMPDDELLDRASALAHRMALLPLNQLQMLKLVCNDVAAQMYRPETSRLLGTLFDGVARHTQEGLDFVARAQDVGFRQAVRERDDPFGDYGSRPATKEVPNDRAHEVRSGFPCWVDAQSPDVAASTAFYAGLFGWTSEDQGEEAGHYTLFKLRGLDVAAIGPLQAEGMPPVWTTYLASDDVDETAKKAEAAGGAVFMPPFDIFDSGRMTVVADPSGAAFGVWQAKEHIGARLVQEPNSVLWNELNSRDLASALPFYETVFGITANEIPMGPDGQIYRELQVNGETVGGAMEIGDDWPAEVPSHWMVYFAVEDTDATAARATALGGNVNVPPSDVPSVGRFAVLSDPGGAHFSIMTPDPEQP